MKYLRKSDHLSEREITDLLRGPEKCLQHFYSAVEVLDRASLKESLAQALELVKAQNDLEHVEVFKDVLCNFDQITFLWNSRSNCGDYFVKDSVFFTMLK